MTRRLIAYGASGHGKVVVDAALAEGWEVVGFADDDGAKRGQRIAGRSVVAAGIDELRRVCEREGALVIVSVGHCAIRKRLFDAVVAAGLTPGSVVHPSAVLAPGVWVGAGTLIAAGAVVNPATRIGANAIVNTSVSLDHDDVIGDHVHVAPGAHLGGTVVVGEGTHVGLGASVANDVTIGSWSMVGAGSVVVRDIPDRVVAYGCPARIVRACDEAP